MPYVSLNKQGRCRPAFLPLFGWKYPQLENLETVAKNKQFMTANPGFKFEKQFIEVGDFNNKGENCPMPYFYQNLAEAEYIIATYMYMVLTGYDPEKITILTTYNG
jgi:intron-binding protein aquarius